MNIWRPDYFFMGGGIDEDRDKARAMFAGRYLKRSWLFGVSMSYRWNLVVGVITRNIEMHKPLLRPSKACRKVSRNPKTKTVHSKFERRFHRE